VLAPGIGDLDGRALLRAAGSEGAFGAPEHVIGKTTTQGLQSGLVYGFAAGVDGIVERIP
jgi:pantothenate kinase type III